MSNSGNNNASVGHLTDVQTVSDYLFILCTLLIAWIINTISELRGPDILPSQYNTWKYHEFLKLLYFLPQCTEKDFNKVTWANRFNEKFQLGIHSWKWEYFHYSAHILVILVNSLPEGKVAFPRSKFGAGKNDQLNFSLPIWFLALAARRSYEMNVCQMYIFSLGNIIFDV